jgi:hypothetical protein
MARRQWKVGILLAALIWPSLPASRTQAKPPDLPVDQSFRCPEAEQIPCLDGIGPLLFQQMCQLVLEGSPHRQAIDRERNPMREREEESRRREMLRHTEPLGLVPLNLISAEETIKP